MSDSNGARNVTTPRLSLNKPAVGADLDIWGDFLNANCDTLDNSFLVSGGIFSGPVGGYPNGTAGAPSFSTGSGAGIYPMGASMGVSSFSTNVFTFSLSANISAVPLNLNNNRILNLANPTLGTDAVNLNTLTNTLGAYLPLTGSPPSMLGPISMGGNLINNLALPQNPGDATSKQYVDALIADMRLFVDTWQVAANIPDISNISSITAGDYYIAVTANPSVPETAPSNIPGIGGMSVNNGDMVIYSEATAQYELVRGGPLTVAEADGLYVSKTGDTMTPGGLTVNSNSGISIRNPLNSVQGINYLGFGALGQNIAFGISAGVTYVYQNGMAVAGFLNLSGGAMTGGLSFGSAGVATATDLSRHIALFGTTAGFSITGGTLNHVAGDAHSWYLSGARGLVLNSGGLYVENNLTVVGNISVYNSTLFMDSVGATYLQLQTGTWVFVSNNVPLASIDPGGSVGAYGWLSSRVGLLLNNTAGTLRWSWRLDGEETGGNAGANLLWHAFNDDTTNSLVLSVTRATGLATVIGDPTDPLGIATKQYVDAHSGGGGGPWLPLTGGQLSGSLTVVSNGPTVTLQAGNYPTLLLRATASNPVSSWQVHIDPVGRLNFFEEIAVVYPFRVTTTGVDAQNLSVTASATANSLVVATQAVAGTVRANGGVYYAGVGDTYLFFNPGNSIWSFITNGTDVADLNGGGLLTVASILDTGGVLQMGNATTYLQNTAAGTWAFVNANQAQANLDAAGNLNVVGSMTADQQVIAGGSVVVDSSQMTGFFLSTTGGNSVISFHNGTYLQVSPDQTLVYVVSGATPVLEYRVSTSIFSCLLGPVLGFGAYINTGPPLGVELRAQPIGYGLAEVLRLEPISFTRPPLAQFKPQPSEIGFIAEAVQPIVPEAVVEHERDGETVLGLRESSLIAVTVNAIKELDARLRALEGVSRRVH